MMLATKSKKELYKEVKAKLLTEDFYLDLKQAVRNGLKLYKSNPELQSFVSSYAGIDEDELKLVWDKVFRLIMKIYSGKVKIRKQVVKYKARVNSLANTLYFSLYEVYGNRAIEIMYNILEEYIVPSLSNEEAKRSRLFFVPVSEWNLNDVLALYEEVLAKHSEILCKIKKEYHLYLCSQSSFLPSGNSGGVEKCIRMVSKVFDGVCRHE